MIEYAKVSLWGASFWKVYFKKELTDIIRKSNREELKKLRKYCYEKYYDMHPDVLDDVFSLHQTENSGLESQVNYN